MASIKIYSFDVYDTALVRSFAQPAALFFVLAEKMLAKFYGQPFGQEEISELAHLRRQVEARARQSSDKEDINLYQIYEHFSELTWWRIPTSEMLQAELCLEQESMRPILSTKCKIDELRRGGNQIIFITDMYLPQETIRQILLAHGIASSQDRLYVSGEIGLTKRSGRLFQYVLAQEGLDPGELCHYGDNPQSDVMIPGKLGIKSSFFEQSQLNRYENYMLNYSSEYTWLYAQLTGASRVARLYKGDDDLPELSNLAASVVAPLLTCFVAWVLQNARKNGIERLYFVSRDGQILYKIAQTLAQHMPAPDCRYLYGSRQAWFLPSLVSSDRTKLDWLVIKYHSTAPRHLLKRLDIEPVEIEPILNKYGFNDKSLEKQLINEQIEKFWQVIEEPDVAALILQKAAAARETALAYFCQEGLLSSTKWALVDLGWTLKTQRALRQMLTTVDPNCNVQGYYLGISKERQPIAEAGFYRAFLLEPAERYGRGQPDEYLLQNRHLVEEVFTLADHEQVIGYQRKEGEIQPILRESSISGLPRYSVLKYHELILEYAEQLAKTGLLETHIDQLKQIALSITKEFLSKPHLKEVRAVNWVLVGDDQNDSRRQALTRKLNLKDSFYFFDRSREWMNARGAYSGYFWLEGSIVLSGVWIRLLYQFITLIRKFKQSNGILRFQMWRRRILSWKLL